MAEIVESMPSPGGGIKPDDYPWGEWFDGRPRRLRQGTREEVAAGAADFTVDLRAIRTYVYAAAKERDLLVQTVLIPAENALYVRSHGPRAAAGPGPVAA